jgi:uncharacterized RmlC-like cupin family protein
MNGEIVTIRPTETVGTLQNLPNYLGVCAATSAAQGISMNLVVIPAGGMAEPHYHLGFETAVYVLKGDIETRYGENLAKTIVNHAGDFLFIPPGVPHQPCNLSATEPAMAIVARNDANEQESVRAYKP